MKNAFVIFTILLLATSSFATKATLSNKLSKFAVTEFGRAIVELIQVELESQADPRPKIIELLEQLRQETIDAQTQADTDIANSREFCGTTIAAINADIDSLEETIAADKAEKLEKEGIIVQKREERRIHHEAQTGYETELENARTIRANNQALYEENDAKFAKILDVLRQVRTWIQNRLDTRYNFLQKGEHMMTALAEVKSEEFMKVSPGFGKLVSFIAAKVEKSLESPTDTDATAESGLDRIIQVIDSLITNTEELKIQNINWNNGDIESFGHTETRLLGDIATESAAVSALDIEISGLDQRIIQLEGLIFTNEGILAIKESELQTTQLNCDTQEQNYAQSSADRATELDIIEQVLKIVREELVGRSEYTESVIINSDINVE